MVEPSIADCFPSQCPEETRGILRLWRSVLIEVLKAALDIAVDVDPHEPPNARRFLCGNSRDLHELLGLAGVDPDYFRESIRPRLLILFDAMSRGDLVLRPKRGRGKGQAAEVADVISDFMSTVAA